MDGGRHDRQRQCGRCLGNTVAAEHPIELDLNAVAVTIDTVTTDDMLNAAEKGADVTLSGQTQGVEAGQTVVVKFADQTFTAQVQQTAPGA